MMQAIAHAGHWLLLQAAAAPDTLLMRQVGSEPTVFQKITTVASGLLTLAFLAIAVALIPAAWNLRKTHKKVNDLLDRIQGDVLPLVRHAGSIADNVDYITTSIRADVQTINATVATANRRLQAGIEATEERLRDFHALLDVVQDEAEQIFVSTASTVRGVRGGAAALRGTEGIEETDEMELATDADDDELGELAASVLEPEEEDDVDDGDTEPAARTPARPRVRPRPRRRG